MESRSPTYNSWQAMKKRCLNKKHKGYKDYGEKGITIPLNVLLWIQNKSKNILTIKEKESKEDCLKPQLTN